MNIGEHKFLLGVLVEEILTRIPDVPDRKQAAELCGKLADIESLTQCLKDVMGKAGLVDADAIKGCIVPDLDDDKPGYSAPLAVLVQGEYATRIEANDVGRTEVRHA